MSTSASPLNTGFCSGTVPSAFTVDKYILFLTRKCVSSEAEDAPLGCLLSAFLRDPPLREPVCVSGRRRALHQQQPGLLGPAPGASAACRRGGAARASLSWCAPPASCRHRALRKPDWMSFLASLLQAFSASACGAGSRSAQARSPSEGTRPPGSRRGRGHPPSEGTRPPGSHRGRGRPPSEGTRPPGSLSGRRPSLL